VVLAARRRLDRALGPGTQARALLGAMLLGDRAGLSPEIRRRLRNAGMIHLVAISGLHVGLLVLTVLGLARRSGLGRGLCLVAAFFLLPSFAIAVGGRPSVLRASLALLVALSGRWLGRDGDGRNALALVAAGMVLFRPALLLDPGFQLSFLATAGILLLTPLLAARIPVPAVPASVVALSLAAYLATAPIVAHHFGLLAPVGVAANLLAVPLCLAALLTGLAAILCDGLPALGGLTATAATWTVDAMVLVANGFAARGPGPLRVAAPGAAALVAYYTLGWAASFASRRDARRLLLCAWAVVSLHVHLGPPPARGNGSFEAVLIDVGQGQAVALQGPGGTVLLVDAGGSTSERFDPGERVVLPWLIQRRVRRLEALILTHEDADHAAGGLAVVEGIEVGELWLGPGWHRSPLLRRLVGRARLRGAAVVMVERGARMRRGDLSVEVLSPTRNESALRANDRSLVLLAGEPPARILISGDIERSGERLLLDSGRPLDAEALVLPHHGSRSSSTEPFLERVGPELALVSCGRFNHFGHPHEVVLARLRRLGATTWRTDRHGAILLRAGPRGWTVRGAGRERE
jgi:competence protein ComEC